jgi:coatomer protein complex subunit epsilon
LYQLLLAFVFILVLVLVLQLAINEASALNRIPTKLAVERDEFVYRSYLALGQYGIVLGEIKDTANTNVALRAVKLLATFISNPSTRDTAIFQMKEWLADAAVKNTPSVRLLAATMHTIDDNVAEALKLLGATDLEQ